MKTHSSLTFEQEIEGVEFRTALAARNLQLLDFGGVYVLPMPGIVNGKKVNARIRVLRDGTEHTIDFDWLNDVRETPQEFLDRIIPN